MAVAKRLVHDVFLLTVRHNHLRGCGERRGRGVGKTATSPCAAPPAFQHAASAPQPRDMRCTPSVRAHWRWRRRPCLKHNEDKGHSTSGQGWQRRGSHQLDSAVTLQSGHELLGAAMHAFKRKAVLLMLKQDSTSGGGGGGGTSRWRKFTSAWGFATVF